MTAEAQEIPDNVLETLSDYLDGSLPADKKAEVEKNLADDPVWKRAHDEMTETRDALSGMQKARAPVSFASDVTATIRKRSGGRLFKPITDRMFNILLVIAVLAILVIAWVMWSSATGSLKGDPKPSGGDPGSATIRPADTR
jgi:anti-sigma factor RsiW